MRKGENEMKKRTISILLTLCLVLGLAPMVVFAAGSTKAIQPGASAQSTLKVSQSKLSFAGHEWWVFSKKDGGILTLFAANHDFGEVAFRTGEAGPFENASRYSEDNGYYANNPSGMAHWQKPNEYAGSTLQQKMVSLAGEIPEKEQALIRERDITTGITGQAVSAQKLWALSHDDSMFLSNNEGLFAAQWWTRSSNEVYGYGSWTLHSDGRSGSALNVDYMAAVRPALDLDLSSVLFLSAADGKSGNLADPVPEYTGDEWKLTIEDSERSGFMAKTAAVSGSVVTVGYTQAKVGKNEYLSAIICDADGSISNYGRLLQLDGMLNLAMGCVTIDLSGIDMTGKTLYVFNEQDNGNGMTDYASALREVKLTTGIDEQFTLTPGGRYYFDLSAMDLPGTLNGNLPDGTLHYVPFTYAGTVNAYVLNKNAAGDKKGSESAGGTTDSSAPFGYTYDHSLFIADYALTHTVRWEILHENDLIFGKSYTGGKIDYTLRAPSVGSTYTGSGASERGVPANNEWDAILDKFQQDYMDNAGCIKNWKGMYTTGQDTVSGYTTYRMIRGETSARFLFYNNGAPSSPKLGFRPVLELPAGLSADSLKAVELQLMAALPGEDGTEIRMVVKKGENFSAPSVEGLPRPAGVSADAPLWWVDESGNFYEPGDSVPASVAKLSLTDGYDVIYLPGAAGTGETVTDTKPYDGFLTLRGALFTREGYSQTGWTTIDGGEKDYNFEDIYQANAALTLYPVWTPNQYTVTFEANGGRVDQKTMTATYGEALGQMPIPEYPGYVFDGWSDRVWGGRLYSDKDGRGTVAYDKAGDCTLYAMWVEPPRRTATFDPNGGTLTDEATFEQKQGGQIREPRDPVRKGYIFFRWYTDAACTKAWHFGDPIMEDMTLYAGWVSKSYTISFDSAGGSAIADKTNAKWDEPVLDGVEAPVRNTYEFIGWTCQGKPVTAETVYADLVDDDNVEGITLTAQWRDIEKPTGEISVGTNRWNEFLNDITFGLFFKETQTVTIQAADNAGAEHVRIEYLLSDRKMTEIELADAIFSEYQGSFTINPDRKYVVYVRLRDAAGNARYISSDGLVLDGTSPAIRGVENGKTYCGAQTVTIDELNVDTVTVNSAPVTLDENNSFVLSPAAGKQEIVVTDEAGNSAQKTVTVNDGHTFGEWEPGDGTHTRRCTVEGCGASETDACLVGKATCVEEAACEVCGKVYGELDANNHSSLRHIEAEAATKDTEGNIEYWICEGCGKVYRDAAAAEEIQMADTVTPKLPDGSGSPQTGDHSPALWIALLFLSSGAAIAAAVRKKKKHNK